MTTAEQEERIAVLLTALGEDVAGTVIRDLPPPTAERVQAFIDQFRDDPLDNEEIEDVLDEFLRFFRFAVQQHQQEAADQVDDETGADEEPSDAENAPRPFVPTGDPRQDLQQLEPYQIAGALREENPRTIALVLSQLGPDAAGAVLKHLPTDVGSEAFLILRNPPNTPELVLHRILETTVRKGVPMQLSDVADPAAESNRRTAELLRAMDKSERAQMMKALEEKEPETAAEIKKMLYAFEDLMKIANRSIQKILGEVESSSLALSLKGADPDLKNRVIGNLSKRARATLLEEIEFLGSVKPEEQEMARQQVCEIIAKLDETGDLEMES